MNGFVQSERRFSAAGTIRMIGKGGGALSIGFPLRIEETVAARVSTCLLNGAV